MPQKINMLISNGNYHPVISRHNNVKGFTNLSSNPSASLPKAPTTLHSPILARVHNVKPGCGSCGRH